MDPENKDKTLIRKYIAQQCTPEELGKMKMLMQLSGTRKLFDEVLSESWAGLEPEENTDQLVLNEKLSLFYQRLQKEEEQVMVEEPVIRPIFRRYSFLRYAAVLAIALLSLFIYTSNHTLLKKAPAKELIAMREIQNPNGQRSRIVLPDSSFVYLGAGSKVRFPERFALASREISLEGEAFFEITKNPERPFIVHTGDVQTRVLGTSFRIEAFRNLPLVVSVATGKVRVDKYQGNVGRSLAVLTPGQKVTYQEDLAVAGTVVVDDVKSWKDARLVFDNQSLKAITTELERWYNVKIDYGNKTKAREKISVVLQADVPLNKIMKVLSATGHFKYQINQRHVQIN